MNNSNLSPNMLQAIEDAEICEAIGNYAQQLETQRKEKIKQRGLNPSIFEKIKSSLFKIK